MRDALEEALQPPAGIGHNNPPDNTEVLAEGLADRSKELLARHQKLIEAVNRLPEKCTTADEAQKLTSFGAQLKGCIDALEERRKDEKRPFDDLASVVHSYFKTKMAPLESAIMKVKTLLKTYDEAERARLRAAEEERRAQEAAAAKRQQEEADKLAAEAARLEQAGMTAAAEKTLAQAAEVEQAATNLATSAAAPAAPVKNIMRGSVGGSASSQGKWEVRITDIDAIDLNLLHNHFGRAEIEKALRSLMREAVKKLKPTDAPPVYQGFEIVRDSSISFRK